MKSKLLAEFVGTFVLVFAGTGAIIVDEVSGGRVTHVGVSLVFGLAVMAMVFAFGEVSGSHLNPAVTLGMAAAGRMAWQGTVLYVIAQALGAILASLVLWILFPSNALLGSTIPAGSSSQAFILETLLTVFLMVVVLGVSVGAKERARAAPFAVGGIVALDALFGGPITGASMNPARSLGPALVSNHLDHLWIYVAAPCCGSLLAVATWRGIASGDQRLLAPAPSPTQAASYDEG